MRRLVMVMVALFTVAALAAVAVERRAGGGSERVAVGDGRDHVRSTVAPDDCELPEGPSSIADANLGFAWRSFRAVDDAARREGEPTATYSPYSAATALHMLANGADPGTDAELLAALCLRHVELGQFNGGAAGLRERLQAGDEVEVANAIWTSPAYTPTPRMDTTVRDSFGGEVGRFEVGNADPINAWIADATKDRVNDLLDDPDLHSDLVMLLASAITFDGAWKARFEEPRPGPFTLTSGDEVDVPMLRDERELDYAFSEQDEGLPWADEKTLRKVAPAAFHAVRVPYRGDRYALVLVVPALDDGLDAVLEALGPARWRELRESFETTSVSLAMPTLDLAESRDIKDPLLSIGVPEFSYDALVNERDHPPIHIDYVKQGTFLQLDERGTKAAAATIVGASVSAGFATGIPVVADHPYLLAIESVADGELLFLSAVRDPRGED